MGKKEIWIFSWILATAAASGTAKMFPNVFTMTLSIAMSATTIIMILRYFITNRRRK